MMQELGLGVEKRWVRWQSEAWRSQLSPGAQLQELSPLKGLDYLMSTC